MPTLRRRWTVADLEDLPDNDGNRYEVIDGELLVTPAPTLRHQVAVAEMMRLLGEYLRRQTVGYVLMSPADITLSATSLVQPDVLVAPLVAGRRAERWQDVMSLMLAVEVLSPSTARADRVEKRTLYREHGVAEYWIVDLDSRTIERSTPADDRVEVIAGELSWMPAGASEALVLDAVAYFAEVLDR